MISSKLACKRFPRRLHSPIEWRLTLGSVILLSLIGGAAAAVNADFGGSTYLMQFDDDPINYSKSVPTGPIEKLQARIDSGQTQLKFDPEKGYLLSVMKELQVPKASQTLVFSKSSFQRDRISPKTPRALYFNDDAYLGFIPGAPLLEVEITDPNLGAVFYTLDQTKTKRPRFVRNNDCLECHASANSMGIPGPIMRSFRPDEGGNVDFRTGGEPIDDRTPMAERWGGWYVTGTHGHQATLGNLFGAAAFQRHETKPWLSGNVTNLAKYFNTTRYPTPDSDIVALMVLEHQSHMHDFITRINFEAKLRIAQYGQLKYLDSPTEAFVKYLLFAEEAPLTAPVKGTSNFAAQFEAEGPRDHRGRSLRDFDLRTRLFKYPCSYLIYSDDFNALPAALKADVYQRMWDILTGKNASPDYQRLTPESRRAVLEILADTKTDLPPYWKALATPTASAAVPPAALNPATGPAAVPAAPKA